VSSIRDQQNLITRSVGLHADEIANRHMRAVKMLKQIKLDHQFSAGNLNEYIRGRSEKKKQVFVTHTDYFPQKWRTIVLKILD
jgi:hypothetical protein